MVFLASPIPGPAAPKVANFPVSVPWFFGLILGRPPDPFMVFFGSSGGVPAAARRPGSLPTFRGSCRPVPRILANFSADLLGVSTANLENFKLSVVCAEKMRYFRGESLEVANDSRGLVIGATPSRCDIIFIIVSNNPKRMHPLLFVRLASSGLLGLATWGGLALSLENRP